VRMLVPPILYRREIDRDLAEFFRSHRQSSFRRAISALCRYFNVKLPRIEWFEYIDWGKTAGKTYEDGRIHLVHPSRWKRGRIYYTERLWVQMVYHEMGHYLLWTDAERKANMFARRMITGLRARPRRVRSGAASARTARRRAAASRAASRRASVSSSASRRKRSRSAIARRGKGAKIRARKVRGIS
jgi:hypothetical protein